ncbi:MAG: biotin/lipoyl-binding protein, partial [Armatimonadetes bacterium]|nr:biotin/lipoyl-binding protein [Armatimonadota bacterium]
MRRILPRILLLCLLVGAAVAAVEYQRRNPSLPRVTIAEARWDSLTGEWSATGYVECRTADVTAPQPGRVAAVVVQEGDSVSAGQVLARLAADVEAATVGVQAEGVRVAAAQAAGASAGVRETVRVHQDRVRRAEADVEVVRMRKLHAEATLERQRQSARAAIIAAQARAAAAREEVARVMAPPRAEEITQAEAVLADARATADRTRIERERQTRLFAEKAVPRRAVEDAEEALVRAEAAVVRARAGLDLARRGPREEEIAVVRAHLRAAEEDVRAAEVDLAGLDAEETGLREQAAAVQAAVAALAEARTGLRNVESLRQEARAAGARVNQAAAALRQSRAGLAEREVVAPFPGSIGRRLADPGDIASPSTALFTLVEDRDAWVSAEVDAQDLAPITPGGRA